MIRNTLVGLSFLLLQAAHQDFSATVQSPIGVTYQKSSLVQKVKQKITLLWVKAKNFFQRLISDSELIRILIIVLIAVLIASIFIWFLPWPLDVLFSVLLLIVALVLLLRYI
ncbi:MAG: hypothetical protein ACUVRD_05305 [Bacteroidia bacterium]